VLLHRFDPLAVLQAIDRYRVTWWYGMAPMNVAVMQVPDAGRFDLRSLRLNPTTSFGIVLTEPLARQWQAFTGGALCYALAYGLSETHTCDTYMPSDAVRWGSHGRLAPGVQCRIVDPDTGATLPVGEAGEITLRSPGNFRGYWNRPEATASTLREGWVFTGDMGRLDADGYLTFMGRFKEMIKVSGYSVFPEEVERLLILHPDIAAAAVIGVPDATKGEVVKAVIVRKQTAGGRLTEQAVIDWSRENMSAYKVPRFVEFRDALVEVAWLLFVEREFRTELVLAREASQAERETQRRDEAKGEASSMGRQPRPTCQPTSGSGASVIGARFVSTVPSAKSMAPARIIAAPGSFAMPNSRPCAPRRMATPVRPITSARIRCAVSRSPRKAEAASAAQTGMV
jgi:acyl-CoA synthetase (AMP-forming)/AMP-acid ligase II